MIEPKSRELLERLAKMILDKAAEQKKMQAELERIKAETEEMEARLTAQKEEKERLRRIVQYYKQRCEQLMKDEL
ncbi:MAG: hypothetical protein LIP03_10315 [Bacteroidales bacterium]|nr:hypothetical protein [Bacteroidales bacterium]